MALGKNTTIAKVEDIVRFKTGTSKDDSLTAGMMLDLINFNCAELAKKLNEVFAPFYMSSGVITLSGSSYPITSLKIDKIIKLVDSSLGQISFVPPDVFERASSFSSYANSLMAVQEGEQIRIFKGSALGSHGTLTLHYYRTATAGTARTDYPDVPDSFTSTLVKMCGSDVVSYKNGGRVDAAKEQDITQDIEQSKQAWANLKAMEG